MGSSNEVLIQRLKTANGIDGYMPLVELCKQAARVISNLDSEIADKDAQIRQFYREQDRTPEYPIESIERPKARITLGDLQKECLETGHHECLNGQCTYYEVCPYRNNIKPKELDLDAPIHYSEKTMSLFRSFYLSGAVTARIAAMVSFVTEHGVTIGTVHPALLRGVVRGDVVDLALLCGPSDVIET